MDPAIDGFSVAGKTALITGAGRGLGFAQAQELANRGATIVITDIDEAAAASACERIKKDAGRAFSMPLDVTSEDGWTAALRTCHKEAGGLDILVNNAGVFLPTPATQVSRDELWASLKVNTAGVFLGCKLAFPYMRDKGGGSIINISSVGAVCALMGTLGYSASKGGVNAMSRVLASEFGQAKVRVNMVMPGPNKTEMNEALREDPEAMAALLAPILLNRLGEPAEVAKVVAFLASDASSYITGAEIPVDGGALVSW